MKVIVHVDGINYGMDSIILNESYVDVVKNEKDEIVNAEINFDSAQAISTLPGIFDGLTSLKTCAVTGITIDDIDYYVEWQGCDDDINTRVYIEASDREAWYILTIKQMEAM